MRCSMMRSRVARNASRSAADKGSSPKQVRVPEWQTGPLGHALMSSVSRSQSLRTSASCNELPDVSPFSHRRCLLRLKNTTRRRSSVACSASTFMKPSISTAPVPACCTMAGSSPPPFAKSSCEISATVTVIVGPVSARIRRADRNPKARELALQIADGDRAAMEHARRERRVDARALEHIPEMLDGARSARCDERYLTDRAHRAQLLEIVAAPYAIARHAVEHDLARAALLSLGRPGECVAAGVPRAARIAGELEYPISTGHRLTVDAYHDALRAEARGELIDQARVREGRGIDRHFFRAGIQHFLCIGDRADAACDAERNVEHARDAAHPRAIDRAAFGTCRNVVEHELVRAAVPIALRELENVSDDAVIAEADAFDDLAVADV